MSKIKVGARSNTPKNLSYNHYTTMGFGTVVPVGVYEVCPKENMTIKPRVFSRVAPQFLPNLGTIDMNLHAFYVPYHIVWKHFPNFFSRKECWLSGGATTFRGCPTTSHYELSRLFRQHSDLATVTNQSESISEIIKDADFVTYFTQNNTDIYYGLRLTKKGKFVYQLLSCLGLKFNFDLAQNGNSNYKMSILPLMCFFKAFIDRYVPSQLQASSPIHQFFEYIESLSNSSLNNPIGESRLYYLFNYVYTYYQRNYFTLAWVSPNSPTGEVSSQNVRFANDEFHLEFDPGGLGHDPDDDNYYVAGNKVTSDNLNLLQKVHTFFRRLNLAGSRSLEVIRSLFGVGTSQLENRMSVYLGSQTVTLQKSDVTVTGNSEEAGDYAGKAWFVSQDVKEFKVNADYHGMVFVMASIQTPSSFVDGVRRICYHTRPSDFYNPDFDGTLMQAVHGSELLGGLHFLTPTIRQDIDTLKLSDNDIYGFLPRYSELQLPLDNVSGDFDLEHYSQNIDAFILPRRLYDKGALFTALSNGNDDQGLIDHGYALPQEAYTPLDALSTQDSVQFNRIFKKTDGLSDPFQMVFTFDTLSYNPIIPIDETQELFGRGKELEFETNGNYVN